MDHLRFQATPNWFCLTEEKLLSVLGVTGEPFLFTFSVIELERLQDERLALNETVETTKEELEQVLEPAQQAQDHAYQLGQRVCTALLQYILLLYPFSLLLLHQVVKTWVLTMHSHENMLHSYWNIVFEFEHWFLEMFFLFVSCHPPLSRIFHFPTF